VALNNRCQVDLETQENGLETEAILEHVAREDVILVVLASTWLSHPTMERLANWWERYLGTNLPLIFRGETTDGLIADLDHTTMEQHLRSHAWATGRNKLEQAEPHERGYSPEEGFTPNGINAGQSSHGEYPTLFPRWRAYTCLGWNPVHPALLWALQVGWLRGQTPSTSLPPDSQLAV